MPKRFDPSPRRILHILQTPRAEGTPNMVLDWLTAGLGHWQGVVALQSRPADLTARLRAAADAYEEHDALDAGRYRKFLAIAKVCRSAVARHRPDVTIVWPTGFSAWACAGARLGGCRRLLVHAGNPAGQSRRNRLITKYVAWPLALLRARVVCCSRYVRDSYRAASGVNRSLYYVVYNCIRSDEVARRAGVARKDRPPGPPTAVMVATLEDHKDHATLLAAVPAIRTAVPGFRLWLVGDGRLRAEIERRIAAEGLGGCVELLGTRLDVPELLGRADAFVFSTTRQEGLGSVLLEALASNLPVVATDVPACGELLAGGRWGTLVPPGEPGAFSAATIAAMERSGDPEAAAYAASFTPARMAREYLGIAGGGRDA